MSDNDLNAELENLFSTNTSAGEASKPEAEEVKPQEAEEPKAEAEVAVAPAAAPRKPMLGAGNKNKGRGLGLAGVKKPSAPAPAAPAAETPSPAPAPAKPAPSATQSAPKPAPVPVVAPVAAAPAGSAGSKVTMIFAILSTFFCLILCVMLNNANSTISNLQTAIETLSQRQNEQGKKVEQLGDGLKKFSVHIVKMLKEQNDRK